MTYDLVLTHKTREMYGIPEEMKTRKFARMTAGSVRQRLPYLVDSWTETNEDELDDMKKEGAYGLVNHYALSVMEDVNRHSPEWGYIVRVGETNDGELEFLVSEP